MGYPPPPKKRYFHFFFVKTEKIKVVQHCVKWRENWLKKIVDVKHLLPNLKKNRSCSKLHCMFNFHTQPIYLRFNIFEKSEKVPKCKIYLFSSNSDGFWRIASNIWTIVCLQCFYMWCVGGVVFLYIFFFLGGGGRGYRLCLWLMWICYVM